MKNKKWYLYRNNNSNEKTILLYCGGVNSQAYVCIPNVNLNNAITQMEGGSSPQEIIDWLYNNDACNSQNFNPEYRQYGIADFDENGDPRTAGFSGTSTDDYKEDRQGATFTTPQVPLPTN